MTPVVVHGARQHNLKNITCSIPRGQLVVITGPSGSGKSSLAFGTLYAEAQRRYAEVLPRASRKHLDHLPRPDVDDITGLSPVVALKQGLESRSVRATLGTFSEISAYLARAFAHGSTARCPIGGHPLVRRSAAQIVQTLLRAPAGTKMTILAPILRKASRNEVTSALATLNASGFVRILLNGCTMLLADVKVEQLAEHSSLDLVVDRIVVREGIETRLNDSVELALREGNSVVLVDYMDGNPPQEFSDKLVCRAHGVTLPNATPQLFSFTSSVGACPACHGAGTRQRFDMAKVVPNPRLSLRQGAVAVFGPLGSVAYATAVHDFVKRTGLDPDAAWAELDVTPSVVEALEALLDEDPRDLDDSTEGAGASGKLSLAELDSFTLWDSCRVCNGSRLGPHAAHFTLQEKTLPEWSNEPLDKLDERVRTQLEQPDLLQPLWLAIQHRLRSLLRLGLGYLSLDTPLQRLSSGEFQRAQLAQHISGGLSGVLYVLDEPTASLSPQDTDRVIDELDRLLALGNSLIVVEHNLSLLKHASHLIDMGPSAGPKGGHVVASGAPETLCNQPASVTGPYLSGQRKLVRPLPPHQTPPRLLRFEGLGQGNLKNICVDFPLGRVTVVTGPSGSGKTTLLMRALLPTIRANLNGTPAQTRAASSATAFARVMTLDQSPIGRNYRSTLVTYSGLLTPLRELFASLPEARTRGFKAARFSYNAKGGRCESCKGEGVVRLDLELLSELATPCPECLGARFNRETLAPKFHGLNIADVLALTVDEALPLFSNVPKLAAGLRELSRLGLGYVVLGQPAPSLSGGEAQRIRLATELSKTSNEPCLYLFDEPMNGLHPADIQQVLDALFALCDAGHTVMWVEHKAEVAALADWEIQLGPGAGPNGGQVVYCGPSKSNAT